LLAFKDYYNFEPNITQILCCPLVIVEEHDIISQQGQSQETFPLAGGPARQKG
jgi:hypothetical protein